MISDQFVSELNAGKRYVATCKAPNSPRIEKGTEYEAVKIRHRGKERAFDMWVIYPIGVKDSLKYCWMGTESDFSEVFDL